MSKTIMLVKYTTVDTYLSENESNVIDQLDISDEIASILSIDDIKTKISIQEEDSKDLYTSYSLNIIDIPKIIKICEDAAINISTHLSNGIINDKERNDSFDKLTAILTVRKILRKKLFKFSNNSDVCIIVEG